MFFMLVFRKFSKKIYTGYLYDFTYFQFILIGQDDAGDIESPLLAGVEIYEPQHDNHTQTAHSPTTSD